MGTWKAKQTHSLMALGAGRTGSPRPVGALSVCVPASTLVKVSVTASIHLSADDVDRNEPSISSLDCSTTEASQ